MLLYITTYLLWRATVANASAATGDCYFIDGSNDTSSRPCYALDTVGASMCCNSGEGCRPDGLCNGSPQYGETLGPYDGGKSIWRRSCSDITWQDAACIAIAPSE